MSGPARSLAFYHAALEAAGASAVTPQRMDWGVAIDARDPDGHALTLYRLRR